MAGIRIFVVRAQQLVSQDSLYFFFGSLVRGVRGFVSDTIDRDRLGFLQNSGMPLTRKVSRCFSLRCTGSTRLCRISLLKVHFEQSQLHERSVERSVALIAMLITFRSLATRSALREISKGCLLTNCRYRKRQFQSRLVFLKIFKIGE